MNCTNGQQQTAYPDPQWNTEGTGQFYGFHTGGMNVLLVDGSVRFLRQTINIRTFAQLVTRSGGEILNSSDF